jgi:riboflavin-specific deaminase-like protein
MRLRFFLVLVSSWEASLAFYGGSNGIWRRRFAFACLTQAEWNSGRGLVGDIEAVDARQLPLVTLKIALDAQGAVDDRSKGDSWRFTGESSLDLVHRLRADADAVAVGSGTVVRDNPSLTVRRVTLPKDVGQPLRVVFDRRLRTPPESALLRDGHRTQFFFSEISARTESMQRRLLSGKHMQIISAASPDGLLEALSFLWKARGVRHLMVEGGPSLAKAFLNAGLVDRAIVITAPLTFQDPVPSGISDSLLRTSGLENAGEYSLGADTVQCWSRPGLPWPSENMEAWP